MANRTVHDALSIRGTNPQFLIEKIIRCRIYESKYWKEECFALSAVLIVDKAMELRYVGGVYGSNIKPTPFLCLVLKLLQIQPEKDIVVEFIKNEKFKYVRALGALYMRLVGTSIDCYNYLEPLLNDCRKLRRQTKEGKFVLMMMDDFVDALLHEERLFDIILPRIQKRYVLEESNELEPRVSALYDDLDENLVSSEEDIHEEETNNRKEKRNSEDIRSIEGRERKRRHKREEKTRGREKENWHRSSSPRRSKRNRDRRDSKEREVRRRDKSRKLRRHDEKRRNRSRT